MTKRPSVLPLLVEIAIGIAGRMAPPRDPPAPPPDTRTPIRAAWIGFLGSVAGAGIAGMIAVWALAPAYKQTEAAQRQAAVSSGQILRARFKAANDEMNILLKGGRLESVPTVLALDPDDAGRSAWISRHPEQMTLIRDNFIPFLDCLHKELFDANASTELPDLDRAPYVLAVVKFRDLLHTTLDGKVRENGSIGREVSDDEWRAHVNATSKFAQRDWPRARLIYNNRINMAQQVLRWQIAESDRFAMGEDAARSFRDLQQSKLPIDDDWPAPLETQVPVR